MNIEERAKKMLSELKPRLEDNQTRMFVLDFIKSALLEVRRESLEEACGVVFRQCGSDNVAQRTVDAIRKLKESEA